MCIKMLPKVLEIHIWRMLFGVHQAGWVAIYVFPAASAVTQSIHLYSGHRHPSLKALGELFAEEWSEGQKSYFRNKQLYMYVHILQGFASSLDGPASQYMPRGAKRCEHTLKLLLEASIGSGSEERQERKEGAPVGRGWGRR